MAGALTELWLMATWHPGYWRSGIAIWRSRVDLPLTISVSDLATRLTQRYRTAWVVPIRFEPIGAQQLAFREQLIQLSPLTYTPVMRGTLMFVNSGKQLLLEGRLYWTTPLVLLVLPLVVLLLTSSLIYAALFAGLGLAITGVCYAVQRVRFARIAAAVRGCLTGA
jgi:hypothetical protein